MGIIMRPSGSSCSSKVGGTSKAAAAAMIRSKGASSAHPL